jgi:hypothetical protein
MLTDKTTSVQDSAGKIELGTNTAHKSKIPPWTLGLDITDENITQFRSIFRGRCLSSKLSPKLNLFFCSNFL